MTVVCATSEDLASVKKLIAALEARVDALSGGTASGGPAVPPAVARFMPGSTSFFYEVTLDDEMTAGLARFIQARGRVWKEHITVEEAIRRVIVEGIRSADARGGL